MKICDILSEATNMDNNVDVYYHVTPYSNVPNILKQGLLIGIGRLSQSAGEIKNRIYMFKDKTDVEDALMNWLGDEFPDERLAVLKITLPKSFKGIKQHEFANWEYVSYKPIPAKYISIDTELSESPIAYHGTYADFDQFKANPLDKMHYDDSAFFHFGSKDQAKQRLHDIRDNNPSITHQGNLIKANVKIKNPLRMNDIGEFSPWNIVYELTKHKNKKISNEAKKTFSEIQTIQKRKRQNFDRKMSEYRRIHNLSKVDPTPESVRKAIVRPYEDKIFNLAKDMFIRLGYDGIVYKNEYEGSGDSYLVFDPINIKIISKSSL